VASSHVQALPPKLLIQLFGGPPSGAASRQIYQSRFGSARDRRLAMNQGCSRREHASLTQGEWRLLSRVSDVLAYERRNGENRIIVVLNFTADPQVWSAPASTKATIAISTHGDRRGEPVGSTLCLRASEGLLIEPA
jgi:hypothetical protein